MDRLQNTLRGVFASEAADEAKASSDTAAKVSRVDVGPRRVPILLVREDAGDDVVALARWLQDVASGASEAPTLWLDEAVPSTEGPQHLATAMPMPDAVSFRATRAHDLLRKALTSSESLPAPAERVNLRFLNACGASANAFRVWLQDELAYRKLAILDIDPRVFSRTVLNFMRSATWRIEKRISCQRKTLASERSEPLQRALVAMLRAKLRVEMRSIQFASLMFRPENASVFERLRQTLLSRLARHFAMLDACYAVAQLYDRRTQGVHVIYGRRDSIRAAKALLGYIEAHGGAACASIEHDVVTDAAWPSQSSH